MGMMIIRISIFLIGRKVFQIFNPKCRLMRIQHIDFIMDYIKRHVLDDFSNATFIHGVVAK